MGRPKSNWVPRPAATRRDESSGSCWVGIPGVSMVAAMLHRYDWLASPNEIPTRISSRRRRCRPSEGSILDRRRRGPSYSPNRVFVDSSAPSEGTSSFVRTKMAEHVASLRAGAWPRGLLGRAEWLLLAFALLNSAGALVAVAASDSKPPALWIAGLIAPPALGLA